MNSDTSYNIIHEVDSHYEDSRSSSAKVLSRSRLSTFNLHRDKSLDVPTDDCETDKSRLYNQSIYLNRPELSPSVLDGTSHRLRFPADIQLAKIKAEKSKITNSYRPQKFSITSKKDGLKKFSANYVLYLNFIEEAIKIIVLLFVLTGFLNFVTIIMFHSEEIPNDDLYTVWYSVSVYMRLQNRNRILLILKFALSASAIIIIRAYIGRSDPLDTIKGAKTTITERDFSIYVENLPNRISLSQISEFFKDVLEKERLPSVVKGVMHIPDLRKLIQVQSRLKCLRLQYIKDTNNGRKELTMTKIVKTQAEVLILEKELSSTKFRTDKAIIVFDSIQSRNHIIQKYHSSLMMSLWKSILESTHLVAISNKLEFSSHILLIRECPLPQDVIWENISYLKGNRIKRKFFAFLMSAILIIILIVLLHLIHSYVEGLQMIIGDKFVYLIIALVTLNLSDFWSQKAVMMQKVESRFLSLVFEILWKYWMRSIIFTFCLLINFSVNDIENNSSSLLFIVTVFALLSPLRRFVFLSYSHTLKMYKRLKFSESSEALITQEEAENLFKSPEFDFVAGAQNVSNYFFMALCLCTFSPLSVLLCVVGLVLSYYVDKYNILRRCSKTKETDPRLGIGFYYLFQFDISLQILSSCLYFLIIVYGETEDIKRILLAAGGLLVLQTLIAFFYQNRVEGFNNIMKKGSQKNTYDNIKHKFKHTYLGCYPLKSSRNTF